jgi:hypothetical protein
VLDWNYLNTNLRNASNGYAVYKDIFEKFAIYIKSETETSHYAIKGTKIILNFEENYFDISCMGRITRFKFNPIFDENGRIKSNVDCYHIKTFPLTESMHLGSFDFDKHGTTSIIEPNNSYTSLSISDHYGALYIMNDFIYQSMTK